jgi:hypothetical protein
MQRADEAAQTGEHAAAVLALLGMALQAPPRARTQLAVEVFGHVRRRPKVIALETQAVQHSGHRW